LAAIDFRRSKPESGNRIQPADGWRSIFAGVQLYIIYLCIGLISQISLAIRIYPPLWSYMLKPSCAI